MNELERCRVKAQADNEVAAARRRLEQQVATLTRDKEEAEGVLPARVASRAVGAEDVWVAVDRVAPAVPPASTAVEGVHVLVAATVWATPLLKTS